MSKSLLKQISPSRPRTRTIDWPFRQEGAETARITMRVLGADELEAAHLETVEYFRRQRKKATDPVVKVTDQPFALRERAALVVRAYSVAGTTPPEPIADSTEELQAEHPDLRDLLFSEWASFQNDFMPPKYTSADIDALIEELKKNILPEALTACSSSMLLTLALTLADRLRSSTEARGSGS